MGVGSKWIKLRKSYRDGTLTRNLKSLTRSNPGRLSGVIEGDNTEGILSEQVSNKERKEISEIVTSINGYLQVPPTQESTSKTWKICRVPNNLREIHQHDFDPKLVSIGPLHRHRSHLKVMAEHKKRFLLRLLDSMDQTLELELVPELSTTSNGDHNGTIFQTEAPPNYNLHKNGTTLEPVLSQEQCEIIRNAKIESLVVAMKELEANAKGYYIETFENLDENEFVMMMILDGCFVVELLRLYAKCETSDKETDDPIFNTRWMLPNLQRDLLLFENQLPYPVLNKLFEITRSKADTCSLIELTLKFFDPRLPREQYLLNNCRVDVNPDHLLGLFRSTFISSFILDRRSSSVRHSDYNPMNISITIPHAVEDRQLIHCVTELKEAGVLFKRRENHSLLDIEFKNGKLYIPPLSIDDHTCPVFLNFIAYEQCNINAEPYFTHYFLFFDSLVNSSKDVEHLHYKGIIDHVLGCDEDVADLFNKLGKEVVHDVDDCYLSMPLKEVNRYFHVKRHKWWATWKHDYFSNPWAFMSFLAAIFLLLLTTIQTFFSVFSYFRPPS